MAKHGAIRQFLKRLRRIHSNFWLVVLTFILVTVVTPGIAADRPIPSPIQAIGFSSDDLNHGKVLYDMGRFSEAAGVWRRTAQAYHAQEDTLNQALSLSYLSLAYQDLGNWRQAEAAIAHSLNLLQPEDSLSPHGITLLAQALNTQGSLQLAMGQPERALNTWRRAADTYLKVGDEIGRLGSQINQAQALQTIGLYRRAQKVLEQVHQALQTQPNSRIKASGLRSLGGVLKVVGNLQQSRQVLEESLAIAQHLSLSADISAAQFSLGNTLRALDEPESALEFYQQAVNTAPTQLARLEAQLNQLSLLVETEQWTPAQALIPQVKTQLNNLAPSRMAVYARVNLAESLLASKSRGSEENLSPVLIPLSELAPLLATAVQQAKDLQDAKAESYALGQLGKLYGQTQQWPYAEDLTQQALGLSQAANAKDLTYRWQWQMGRIFKQQAKTPKAIAAYTEATTTLKAIRSDLIATHPEVQFSFRESVEPVYRELVGLLLKSEAAPQQDLKKARSVIEELQLAELENFFRSACIDARPQQIDQVDQAAAVIYPIILADRLEVVLSLPNQSLRHYRAALPQAEVEATLEKLLQTFNPAFADQERLQLSQQVYNWLIQPAEAALAESGVDTLVFVLDGTLRNLPMSALYDGQQYLIEKYSIALTPGLQLMEPRSLEPSKLQALMLGLTESRQGFSALPGVAEEINQISSELPAQTFLNDAFTKTNLENQLQKNTFPVLHLATHGQFSSDLRETFLLAWDEKITLEEFDHLLKLGERSQTNPIELLVLSACQTAEGDKRAALGLAGLAVRSGARSTLATLWSVQDQSTAVLMTEFYQGLLQQSGINKAEGLRQAQLALLKDPRYQHPFYWSPFVLVGNWLL